MVAGGSLHDCGGRIDAQRRPRRDPAGEIGGDRAGTTTHVEQPLAGSQEWQEVRR